MRTAQQMTCVRRAHTLRQRGASGRRLRSNRNALQLNGVCSRGATPAPQLECRGEHAASTARGWVAARKRRRRRAATRQSMSARNRTWRAVLAASYATLLPNCPKLCIAPGGARATLRRPCHVSSVVAPQFLSSWPVLALLHGGIGYADRRGRAAERVRAVGTAARDGASALARHSAPCSARSLRCALQRTPRRARSPSRRGCAVGVHHRRSAARRRLGGDVRGGRGGAPARAAAGPYVAHRLCGRRLRRRVYVRRHRRRGRASRVRAAH